MALTREEQSLISGHPFAGPPSGFQGAEVDPQIEGLPSIPPILPEEPGVLEKLDSFAQGLTSLDLTTAYLGDLIPLLLSISFLAIVVLWFSINNYKNALVIFFIIPLTLGSVGVSYFTVEKLLGYPTAGEMSDDSLYLSHVTSKDEKWIYVWIVEPESIQPRAIIIPATKNNKKQMDGAKNKAEAGIKTQIKKKQDGGEQQGRGQTHGGEFEVYDFEIQGGNLKDYGDDENNNFE